MENQTQKKIFHLTSEVTRLFPKAGARFLDSLILPIAGHPLLVNGIFKRNRKTLGRAPFRKILVIPDIHIGDAVMMQGAVQAFRDFFPDARIDYVVKKSVASLIEGNPAITNLYPYFTGAVFPTETDVQSVQKLVAENNYDLCFNCSPFFEDSRLFPRGQKILNFMTVAPQLLQNEKNKTGINHFLFQSYGFVKKLLEANFNIRAFETFEGVGVTLSDEAVEKAKLYLKEKCVPGHKPVIFLNPDTASPYTLIPLAHQAEILKKILGMDVSVLLGTAFTHTGMEQRLLETLTMEERRKVFVVPSTLPIDAYAALIDEADIFISGDTGPLHIAAARKLSRSGLAEFRNKTFIISIFGATPARMSGYDSANPLFPPANQDAPSRTYVSESPCRNITCVNKMAKTCRDARCFEVLAVEEMAGDIQQRLTALTSKAAWTNGGYLKALRGC
jgi:ADP-heptose:LPS heptosyltransferase